MPVLFKVTTPELLTVASPERAWVTHWEPEPISRLPAVAVVEPKPTPLILATVVLLCVPVTSPARFPVKLVEVATEREEVAVHVGMLPLMVRMVPVEPVAIVANVVVEEFPINKYP